jgi:uncharacterized protein (UPF0297 family)
MFKHYLITRFNLRADYWDVTKNNEQLLTDEWMDNRMWLFENFCFPSVVGQTNQNFEWLLYFDTNTKEVYQNRIQELVANQPNFKVFFVDAMPSFMPELHNYITNESKDKPYLITTRIDNDDSIHIDFINEVQKQFNQQEYQAIDFIKGYSLQIEPNYILGKKDQLTKVLMSTSYQIKVVSLMIKFFKQYILVLTTLHKILNKKYCFQLYFKIMNTYSLHFKCSKQTIV